MIKYLQQLKCFDMDKSFKKINLEQKSKEKLPPEYLQQLKCFDMDKSLKKRLICNKKLKRNCLLNDTCNMIPFTYIFKT